MREEVQSLKQQIEHATPREAIASSTQSIEEQIDTRDLTRDELGVLYGVSREAIRTWENEGVLAALGWDVVTEPGEKPKRYRHNPEVKTTLDSAMLKCGRRKVGKYYRKIREDAPS